MRNILLLPLLVCFASSVLNGQIPALGQWRDLLPYRKINKVAETQSRVYAAGNAGLFYLEKSDNSVKRLSTVDGLLDINVTALGADPEGRIILIGYESGEMDIITQDNRLVHNRNIAASNVIGNKQINQFYFYDGYCYVATGFGILQFDYNRLEFKETFLIGKNGNYLQVEHLTAHDDKLWAATTEGLYYCSFNDVMFNPAAWHQDTLLPDPKVALNYVVSFAGNLLLNLPSDSFKSDQLLIRQNDGLWLRSKSFPLENNFHFWVSDKRLLVSNYDQLTVYDEALVPSKIYSTTDGTGFLFPRYAVSGLNEDIWVGDNGSGLIRISAAGNSIYNLEGPESDKAFNVYHFENKLFVTGGGHPANWFPFYNLPELSVLNPDDSWEVYNLLNQEKLKDIRDIISVAVHPDSPNKYAVATLRQGLVFLETGKGFTGYIDPTNSPLDTTLGGVCIISDIAYDEEGNLWIANSQTAHPLKVLTKDQKWAILPANLQGSAFKSGKMTLASDGKIWLSTLNDGIMVYDPGNTITDTEDDRYRFLNFSPGEGNLPDNQVNFIAEDKKGQMWIATRNGLRVFFNSSDVFSSSFNDAQDIYIQQDGRTQILFENEDISVIAIDGGDRKWFGTKGSGVFLMGQDGTNEIVHFDRENSPIYSNFINSLTLNPITGEVFFATSKGLIAYRGNAPESSDLSNILAFPNPVSRNFEGTIGIAGLSDKTYVKITDVAGNLVFETTAIGGTAIWNGRDFKGNKLAAGVYLVLCVSEDGQSKGGTKILFEK